MHPINDLFSAFWEIGDRYLLPRIRPLIDLKTTSAASPDKEVVEPMDVMPGWDGLVSYANTNNVPLVVYLHAEAAEAERKRYNSGGGRIIAMLDSLGIQVIQDLHVIQPDEYRDYIHLNADGQRAMAERLSVVIPGCDDNSLVNSNRNKN